MNIDTLTSASTRVFGTRNNYAPDLDGGTPDWMLSAPCAQTDPEIFFPDKGGTTLAAKRICRECPFRAECLAFGLEDRFGIYGGLSERERYALRKSGWVPGNPLPEVQMRDHGRASAHPGTRAA